MKRPRERLSTIGHPHFSIGLVTGLLIGFFASSLFFLSASSSRVLENSLCSDDIRTTLRRAVSPTVSVIHSRQQPQPTGWKDIHIFYGDRSLLYDSTTIPTAYLHANTWFSQYRQDELVSRLLHGKRSGYFIDLAANDAVRISNTYALETIFDWEGLCIEPNPVYWTGLAYRKCQVVAAIIGNETMQQVQFRYPKDKAPQGGILGENFDNHRDQWNEGHPRFTTSLSEIFHTFQVPSIIDYISLDVEGAEDLVMLSFPFDSYRFNLMSVERPSASLSTLLAANGYRLLKTIKNVDTLWGHRSILNILDRTALEGIDVENYKYRENTGRARIAPEEESSVSQE